MTFTSILKSAVAISTLGFGLGIMDAQAASHKGSHPDHAKHPDHATRAAEINKHHEDAKKEADAHHKEKMNAHESGKNEDLGGGSMASMCIETMCANDEGFGKCLRSAFAWYHAEKIKLHKTEGVVAAKMHLAFEHDLTGFSAYFKNKHKSCWDKQKDHFGEEKINDTIVTHYCSGDHINNKPDGAGKTGRTDCLNAFLGMHNLFSPSSKQSYQNTVTLGDKKEDNFIFFVKMELGKLWTSPKIVMDKTRDLVRQALLSSEGEQTMKDMQKDLNSLFNSAANDEKK